MATYRVAIGIPDVGGKYFIVEAASPREALKKANTDDNQLKVHRLFRDNSAVSDALGAPLSLEDIMVLEVHRDQECCYDYFNGFYEKE